MYADPGYLFFIAQGTLFARSFDPKKFELKGEAFSVATGASGVTASNKGHVAYRQAGATPGIVQLTWFDRSGKVLSTLAKPDRWAEPELSPDGKRVAVVRLGTNGADNDIWLIDTGRGVETRLTFGPSTEIWPVWSPNGARVAFATNLKGANDIYEKSAAGEDSERPFLETPERKHPSDWSRDGKYILYFKMNPPIGTDLWALPLSGDRKPFPVATTPFDETRGQFSPDGKWIAYDSNESGRPEVYVKPFPSLNAKYRVSSDGGDQPRWRGDGKELFYVSEDGKLMAVEFRAPTDGTPDLGSPHELFQTPVRPNEFRGPNFKHSYAVTSDGQRFLMRVSPEDFSATPPITVIVNWKPEPKR